MSAELPGTTPGCHTLVSSSHRALLLGMSWREVHGQGTAKLSLVQSSDSKGLAAGFPTELQDMLCPTHPAVIWAFSWQARGTLWDARDQTWLGHV